MIFSVESVRRFLSHPSQAVALAPLWAIRAATYPDGPVIKHIQWLPDSSGIAFLQTNSRGYDQLFLAQLKPRLIHPLTPADQYVTAFDVRTANSFAYIALSPKIWNVAAQEKREASIVGTGRILYTMLFPQDLTVMTRFNDLSELWAVLKGKRVRVRDDASQRPIQVHFEGWKVLKLSPDGRSVVTALAVESVPLEWEAEFAPRRPVDPYRFKAGYQDLAAFNGGWYVSQYARIDLVHGHVTPLTHAPIGEYAGWWSAPIGASWSADGQSIVVTNTFIGSNGPSSSNLAEPPCMVVLWKSHDATCLEPQGGSDPEKSNRRIAGLHVVGDEKDHIVVDYDAPDGSETSICYRRQAQEWIGNPKSPVPASNITVIVKQGLNEPPVLVASDSRSNSRVIFDPNPQLRDIELSEASLYKWQDKEGRNWVGGLYKPRGYVAGRRYPLVIQTHGFHPSEFRPDGVYPTAFAAQELAALGMMVLQAPDCPVSMDPTEGPCSVGLYESVIEKLIAEGLVDPVRVGIIGFSRTCFYVMEALTASKIHFAAASITDGVNEGYLQYLIDIDTPGNGIVPQADGMMGGPPFGPGLQKWLKNSPEFNLDKVTTPLQVVVTQRFLVDDWEPYAGLRILKKPVDLIVLRNGTHVLSNPAERLASQGATVDWFSFWLLDTEDPSTTKAAQYVRWRRLRMFSKNGFER
jgi:dipeptidyl aminopeptidase/acylaminoacyl peptidase